MVEERPGHAGGNVTLPERIARLHVVWLWLLACVVVLMISQLTGAGLLDGGFGSTLFGVLFVVGAPFLIVGRIGVAATAGAPGWMQAITVIVLVLAFTALADLVVTRALKRMAQKHIRAALPPD
jgi:hypothetical protein